MRTTRPGMTEPRPLIRFRRGQWHCWTPGVIGTGSNPTRALHWWALALREHAEATAAGVLVLESYVLA